MWHVFVSNQPGAVRPGSLGRVVPASNWRCATPTAATSPTATSAGSGCGATPGPSATGRTRRSPTRPSGASGSPAATSCARDADGFVHYVGRGDDALKVGGKWLLPAEVEDCLLTHAAVTEAAVVGVPDGSGLTRPVAFVVPAAPAGRRPRRRPRRRAAAALPGPPRRLQASPQGVRPRRLPPYPPREGRPRARCAAWPTARSEALRVAGSGPVRRRLRPAGGRRRPRPAWSG